ncbi:hypothetical protein [Thiothrix subterranea]|uniref:Lipoprotein n=3 Tax=Thiothrix subterranea TaxID=2735563 RepID=A0AA51QWJ2_9GAMM|nr:hypothetical protein [Thiothrix subterranea]MDQ5769275.1 hypothetical protein [Thiothrix subterranea]WML86258.1 hypothetical protein RCG00_18440 [Thiothrix subterranea]
MNKISHLLFIPILLLLGACSDGNIKQDNAMTQIMMQKEMSIDRQYQNRISQMDGSMKGLEEALVKGLTDSLRTANVSRDIASEALALAKENSKKLDKLIADMDDLESKTKKALSSSSKDRPASTKAAAPEASFAESATSNDKAADKAADKPAADDNGGFTKIE